MLTPAKVHFVIQALDAKHSYDNVIAVQTIAAEMNISINELLTQIHTLNNMSFIKFTDQSKKDISLTLTGKYAVVPD